MPSSSLFPRASASVRASRSRTITRRVQRSLIALATFAAIATGVTACSGKPEWRGTPVSPARTIAPTSFTDSSGATVPLLPPDGQAALVFFGYTNCPDVCPTTMADWVRVKQSLGADAARVRFVLVSIDPARDTPAVTQRYAANFDSTFIGLSASPEQTAAVQNAFGSTAAKADPNAAAGHELGHSSQSYLVDARGNILVEYRYGAGWDVVSADLKTLLRQ